MLLYVDKKKLKRRKIKIAGIIISCTFALMANIISFKTALHKTTQSLTTYKTLQTTQDWYNKADIVHLFTSKRHKQIKAVLIPEPLNRENAQTIALALSKLPQNSNLILTDDVLEKDYLQQISSLFTLSVTNTTQSENIIVTTDINNIISLINEQKLFPQTLYYKQTIKLQSNSALQQLLDRRFPPIPQPQNTQEKQQQAIQNFADTYRTDLLSLLHSADSRIAFTTQNLMLQNLGICLSSATQTTCSAKPDCSIQQNIHAAQANLQAQTPQKLYLLTSLEEIPVNTVLTKEDGVFFRFGTKETFILPQNTLSIPNNTDIYAYLKQQAGLNPDYNTPDMKFYKFKTTEIHINDNI